MASKIAAGLLLLASSAAALVPNEKIQVDKRTGGNGGCNADNCYRALLNTEGHFSTRGGVRDCSFYLISTVYPTAQTFTRYSNQTFTSTVTTSITDTVIERTGQYATATTSLTSITFVPSPAEKRNDNPNTNNPTIPSWASTACSSGAGAGPRFSSACSCLGVTATTITASAPEVTTKTVYVSITSLTTTTNSEATITTTSDFGTVTETIPEVATATATCAFNRPCTVTAVGDLVSACGGIEGEYGCACNAIPGPGVGFVGECVECIGTGGFCGSTDGTNCCSRTCRGGVCE